MSFGILGTDIARHAGEPTRKPMTKKEKGKYKLSEPQILMAMHCRELGYKNIEYEFAWHPLRKWRADIVLHNERILIECDGNIYAGGHKRGAALEDDYIKQNEAQKAGWRILRFSNRQVTSGEAKQWLASL